MQEVQYSSSNVLLNQYENESGEYLHETDETPVHVRAVEAHALGDDRRDEVAEVQIR